MKKKKKNKQQREIEKLSLSGLREALERGNLQGSMLKPTATGITVTLWITKKKDEMELTADQCADLKLRIDERIKSLGLPVTATGYIYSAIKDKFLPEHALNWMQVSQKDAEAIPPFIETWTPSAKLLQDSCSRA